MTIQENYFLQLMRQAANNGWNANFYITSSINENSELEFEFDFPTNNSTYFGVLNAKIKNRFDECFFSINDIVTNTHNDLIGFIEALCIATNKTLGFADGQYWYSSKISFDIEFYNEFEEVIFLWDFKIISNVPRKRHTVEKLIWLFDTFEHLLQA